MSPKVTAWVVVVALCTAFSIGGEAAKVRTQVDKAFDFSQAKTWRWSDKGAGDVMVAKTPTDDPAVTKARAEPIILEMVPGAMRQRGYELSPGNSDLTLTYYLLLTVGTNTQTMGQFLPTVANWGLPPFAPQTTSIEAIERGSFVLDIAAKGAVVWRGIAEAQIQIGLEQAKRADVLRDAIRDVIRKVPKT